ncbi:MAG: ANTAR domain-containing protein [Pseudomonadota bacterium]
MTTDSKNPPLNVLVVNADTASLAHMQQSLGDNYLFQAVRNGLNGELPAAFLRASDVLLIRQETVDLPYLEQVKQMIEAAPMPVMIFVDDDPSRLAPVAIRYGITSFIVAGFEIRRVPTLIEVTVERFKLHNALRSELLKSQEELAARKVIERAKGLLMDRKQLNEQEAYRSLRELAMRQSKPIREVAETLLIYSDILP